MPQDPSEFFCILFTGFRSRMAVAAFRRAAIRFLLPVLGAAALLIFLRRGLPFSPRWFMTLPFFWAVLTVLHFFRTLPDVPECARMLDRLTNSDSLTVNALEVLRRDGHGDFAVHAVRRGVANFRRWNGELPPYRFPRPELLWLLPLILLLLPLPRRAAETADAERQGMHSAPGAPADGTARRHPAVRENSERLRQRNELANPNDAPAIGTAGIPGGSAGDGAGDMRRGAGRSPGHGSGGSAAAASEPRIAGSASAVHPETVSAERSAGGISGDGVLGAEENAGINTGAAGISSGDSRMASRTNRRRRPRRRDVTVSRGGLQPLGADSAPPAGRDLSDPREGESGKPDNGRGGESDVKKSRGAAFSLPVMPMPDTVAGRLGPGEDMTATESAPPGRGARKTSAFKVGNVVTEPYLPVPTPPRSIRERISGSHRNGPDFQSSTYGDAENER